MILAVKNMKHENGIRNSILENFQITIDKNKVEWEPDFEISNHKQCEGGNQTMVLKH